MPRRRQIRTLQLDDATGGIGHRQLQARLQRRAIGRADRAQKRVCLVIAAEQDVLPVVDAFAGGAIGKRRRAATKARGLFDYDNFQSRGRQAHRGTEPGKAGADDDDISRCRRVISNTHLVRHQALKAIRACAGRGTRTTSVKTSYRRCSIRSSNSQ